MSPVPAGKPRSATTTALLIIGAVIVALIPVGVSLELVDRRNEARSAESEYPPYVSPAPYPVQPPPTMVTTTVPTTPCVPPEWPPNPPTNPPPVDPNAPSTTRPLTSGDPSTKAGPTTKIIAVDCSSKQRSTPYRYDPTNAKISVNFNHQNTVEVFVHGDERWGFAFTPPEGQELARGQYSNVKDAATHNPLTGGFRLSSPFGSCNGDGRATFRIYEITVVKDTVVRLVATFEHHCETGGQPSYGVIDFST
jgi:hypothetical protein